MNNLNNTHLIQRGPAFLAGLVAVTGWLLLGAGCQTTSPTGDKVLAFETIKGRSLSEIRLATLEVFQKNGFPAKTAFGRDLVFEQKASRMSGVLFGSWMDPDVWLRVKIRIEELSTGVNVIQCSVYRVQDRGDNILEDESRAYGKKAKPFEKMLAEIKSKLDALPPGDASAPGLPPPGASQK